MTNHVTRYWHRVDAKHIQCDICPRECQLQEGQRGLCFIRACHDGRIVLTSYGRSSGFCIDPIEKKPLNHFYPGSPVLSFGTAGCNLTCKFCQNWDMSKSREMDTLAEQAAPQAIAEAAQRHRCDSVAMTYNDPAIFLEYAIDTAKACHAQDIKTVAVTAGYFNAPARAEFFQYMDAANIDLKAFTERFYWKLTGSHLQAILETLSYVYHETNTWLEITTLLIPGENDSEAELTALCEWVAQYLSPTVPIHFSAFHPDYKMRAYPATPPTTLLKARQIAMNCGLQFVYTGNIHHRDGDSTFCPNCQRPLIVRDWYQLLAWHCPNGYCEYCHTQIPGHFQSEPGHWGAKRVPIKLG